MVYRVLLRATWKRSAGPSVPQRNKRAAERRYCPTRWHPDFALARGFLKDAPLLLLDEATSALKGPLEEAIREALARLMQNRTVIAIAHRITTVRQFDRILVIGGGRLLQDGSPSDLASRRGPYHDLVKLEGQRRRSRRAA